MSDSEIDVQEQDGSAAIDLHARNDKQPSKNLPLSMQTSSLLIQDGLDIKHGGGGINSPSRNKLVTKSSDSPGAVHVASIENHHNSPCRENVLETAKLLPECIPAHNPMSESEYDTLSGISGEFPKNEMLLEDVTISKDHSKLDLVWGSGKEICKDGLIDLDPPSKRHSTPSMHNSSLLTRDELGVVHDDDAENISINVAEKYDSAQSVFEVDSECLANKLATYSSDQMFIPMQEREPSVQSESPAIDDSSTENQMYENEPSAKRIKLDDNFIDIKESSLSTNDPMCSQHGPGIPYRGNKCNDSQSNMEFDILDELESSESDNEGQDEKSDDESGVSEDEISDDEIYAMLDAGLKYPKPNKDDDLSHEVREKVVLKVRGHDHFDVLPEGWIEITHNSGMPVYLHKQSRVCCMSKPYFLGPGSTRRHEIPISAIPCLHYSRELEKERKKQEREKNADDEQDGEQGKTNGVNAELSGESGNVIVPSARVQCVEESKKEGSLDFMAVREYCQKRFEFQTIAVRRFKTWISRRKHQKMVRRAQQRPTLPENTKLITCPLVSTNGAAPNRGNMFKKEFIMNPVGKSAVCILHEYVQHTLRLQPRYVFRELENASTPYGAVVIINGMEYGSGFGSSKKQAKTEAAKSALRVLIPNMQLFESGEQIEKECQDVEFFDQIRVEDPRVSELCVKAGHPYPYQILLECLKRNYGMGNTDVHLTMHNLKHQKNEFVITVGKHTASVICKNKRDGKQRASQAILQKLHPQITSWGSLLRMYGPGSRQTLREKKLEEQRITELQSNACANKPNMSILNKLKEEMRKYRDVRESMKPIGKLVPERKEIISTSDSNLKNVDL